MAFICTANLVLIFTTPTQITVLALILLLLQVEPYVWSFGQDKEPSVRQLVFK